MAFPPSSTTQTLTLNSSELFVDSYKALSQKSPQNSPPRSFTLLSQRSPLPPIPSDFAQSKLIPKTRFIVDGFRYSGDYSVSYFLSHFHSDHYAGLKTGWSKGLIFCSETTGRLLIEVLKLSSLFVISLSLGEPVVIDGCEVTLVDANHCPGAVQFLFKMPRTEGKYERYVHTGDFRFCNSMTLEPVLSEYVGADAVFLDTTYCNPKFVFPSQDDSVNYIVEAIERIRAENQRLRESVLFLIATYVVGKERILVEISRRCNCMIHVDSRRMSILCILGFGGGGIFTEDVSVTDVHVVSWNVLGETWPYFRPNFAKMEEIMIERGYTKVVGFVPTGWMYEVRKDGFAVRTKDSFEIHLVPYSEHSSYNELREYVRFLRPKRVIPTVGLDVEKLDSKHAVAMQKHFAGLVDEMANKQEFLMGFHRKSRNKDEKEKGNISSDSNKELHKENEVKPSKEILERSPALREPDLQDSSMTSDRDMEESIKEICDSLPPWVTREQMLDLLRHTKGNIVEAMSEFYERETELREQLTASNRSTTSQLNLSTISCASLACISSLLPEMGSVKEHFIGIMKNSLVQDKKPSNMRRSIKSTVSPRKKAAGVENKSNKKAKLGSASESCRSDSKQYTITKFFSKIVPNASLVGEIGNDMAEQFPDTRNVLSSNMSELYKEEINQFLEVIDGGLSRSDAASILEKAKGDIHVALDVYYNNPGVDCDDNDGKLSVQSQPYTDNCSFGKETKSSEESENIPSLFMQGFSTTDVTATFVSLPLEKYSPVEHACWRQGQPAPYLHLARTFDLVEGERSKIKATGILCNMFRSLLALSPKEVLPAVYLCTNKIAADHENMELNIGSSMVTAALEEACGTNRSRIKDMYNTLGDLGDVAQICRQTQSLLVPPPPLTIQDVFSVLRKISVETGNGSAARKKALIVNLIRLCREKEVKFLIRTLVRNLRIGATMRTILPALAQAVVLNSFSSPLGEGTLGNLKGKLQLISSSVIEAYNILPNLDLVVPSLMSKGIEFSSTTLSMVPGIPIRPMLARIANGVPQTLKIFEGRAFKCEYKYDGQRAQIHRLADGSVRIFSRNGDETTSRFPDLVHIISESCKPVAVTFVLDAEVVAVDRKNGCKLMSFQELSSRGRGSKNSLITVDSIKVDICVFAFDIMFANGEQLLCLPLRQRQKYLKDLFCDKLGHFEYAKEITVEAEDAYLSNQASLTKINLFLEDALNSSCEGIMVKSLDVDAGYAASKRTETWLKVKRDYVDGLNDSLDLVPIGAWHGNGRKAGWYSPFLMACYNPDTEEFQSVCRVMSGFSDSFYVEMKEFFSGEKILFKKPPYYQTSEVPDLWFSPELVWEIRGADFTVSPVHQAAVGLVHPSRGISIRFPRFIRSVLDRKPEECSTSEDIADMFHSQTRKMDVDIKD